MERYNKYLVLKIADIEKYLSDEKQLKLDALVTCIRVGRLNDGKRDQEYVCVAADWPMYEQVWGMVEAFVDGKPNEIEQLQAKVAELEEEKKELQALLDFDNARLDQIEDELEDVEYLGPFVEGIKVLKTQLVAAQEEWNQCSGLLDDAHRSIEMLEDQLAKAEQRVAELEAENELLKGRKNVELAANTDNAKSKQQRELAGPMEMGQLLAGGTHKTSGDLEIERTKPVTWIHKGGGFISDSRGKFIGCFSGDFRYRDRIICAVNSESETSNQLAAAQEEINSPPAIDAYEMYMADDEESNPVERLRFFLSLALKDQDWIDVEKFIDDVSNHIAKAEQRVAEWQPISTAPKDAFVLLAGPSGYTTIKTVFATGRMCSDYHKGRWIDHANDDLTDWGFEPTHWMPLPKAPANGASS